MSSDDLRQFGKLLKEIGFNDDRPLSTRQAFLKHLIKAANDLKAEQGKSQTYVEGEQLVFDPEVLGVKKTKP